MLDVMARPGNLMGECPQMTTEVVPEPGLPAQAQAVAQPQEVAAPLTSAAIFLVMVIQPGADNCAAVRDLFSDLAGLLRAVGFRDLDAKLSCVVGIGSQAWDRLAGPARPARVDILPQIEGGGPHAGAPPPGTSCSTSAPRVSISVSNWPPTS